MIKLIENYIKSLNGSFVPNIDFINAQKKLDGLSGALTAQIISKCLSFLNDDLAYLEVGIYQASNLVMVASTNRSKLCVGVDNFSQEFEENKKYSCSTEELVQKRFKDYDLKNCFYIKKDFRTFLQNENNINGKKIGLYFFDGPHELQDQIDGIEMSFNLLADEAIIFIDDLASDNVIKAYDHLKLNKHLQFISNLTSDYHIKEIFNQGQMILKYTRYPMENIKS